MIKRYGLLRLLFFL